jgi:hypothetical protein
MLFVSSLGFILCLVASWVTFFSIIRKLSFEVTETTAKSRIQTVLGSRLVTGPVLLLGRNTVHGP